MDDKQKNRHQIGVVVIGFGYWGPNLCRNFETNQNCKLIGVCDADPNARQKAIETYENIEIYENFEECLLRQDVDAVAIATPTRFHFELAAKALDHGKHIFVEKPLCLSSKEAQQLIATAERRSLVAMVDHVFTFSTAVEKMVEIVRSGELGKLLYFDSVRINLGLFQNDVDVMWDLLPHDLSILFELINQDFVSVNTQAVDHFDLGQANMAYVNLKFPEKFIASFHVNWVSPVKVRKIIIGGTKKMLIFDDLEPSAKISLFDKNVELTNAPSNQAKVEYRMGDVHVPFLSNGEPLKDEIEYFVNCICSDKQPERNTLKHGAKVIQALEEIRAHTRS